MNLFLHIIWIALHPFPTRRHAWEVIVRNGRQNALDSNDSVGFILDLSPRQATHTGAESVVLTGCHFLASPASRLPPLWR